MDRPTEAFKQAQHDANATYYCDRYHGPKAVQAIIVYAEHLESKVEQLEAEVERLRGQLHEMLVDPDNTVSSIYLRHEALRAKLERVRGMGEALADDDTRSGYGCGLAILEILDGEQDGA